MDASLVLKQDQNFKLAPIHIESIIQQVHYKFQLSSIAKDLQVAAFLLVDITNKTAL